MRPLLKCPPLLRPWASAIHTVAVPAVLRQRAAVPKRVLLIFAIGEVGPTAGRGRAAVSLTGYAQCCAGAAARHRAAVAAHATLSISAAVHIELTPVLSSAVKSRHHLDTGSRREPAANQPALTWMFTRVDPPQRQDAGGGRRPTGPSEQSGATAPPGSAAAAECKRGWPARLGHLVAQGGPLAGALIGNVAVASP